MTDWDETPSGDWEGTTSGGVNTTHNKWDAGNSTDTGFSWADEPTADTSLENSAEQSYEEVVEAPAEPAADEYGRSSGVVKVSE